MDDIYKNVEKYRLNKKRRTLTVFDDAIADMLTSKNLHPIVTELFIRGRKRKISVVFITQSYFAVPKNIRLNSMHYFIMKIPNKQELQQMAFNHSSDIDFRGIMNLYKKCTAKAFPLLVIDDTLASDKPLIFRKNHLAKTSKLIMTIDDKIRDEKLQYDSNREAAKISVLLSGKIDKYDHLTGKEILPSHRKKSDNKEQRKFTYSPAEKTLEKQTEKQGADLKSLSSSNEKDTLKNWGYVSPKSQE